MFAIIFEGEGCLGLRGLPQPLLWHALGPADVSLL